MSFKTIMAIQLMSMFLQGADPKNTNTNDSCLSFSITPIRQVQIAEHSKVSINGVTESIRQQLYRLENTDLVEPNKLDEILENKIIDDAVFEVLLTNDFELILERLEKMDCPEGTIRQYCLAARQEEIDYLADISVVNENKRIKVSCTIYDTESQKGILTKSLYHLPQDANGATQETAKLLLSNMWQIEQSHIDQNNKNSKAGKSLFTSSDNHRK